MDYRKYQASRNLAWEVLLREGVCKLPVSTSKLCRSMGIHLLYGDTGAGNDGYSTMVDGGMYIVIREGMSLGRTRFTVAHELGHILLGHVGTYSLVNREPSSTDNPIEREANVFASRLLAPACVLWGCEARTADEIAELCNISRRAAEIRAERMAELIRRNKFLSSPVERQVYEQFLPFIRSRQKLV
ncbi:MAG: ImmA/IrrE family metallo-endopeptidase [Oscillospiraceae bacterium]|nr:ImmA/IrrE family metallo-endopeptidase [Oscillospiraceae bacterium]